MLRSGKIVSFWGLSFLEGIGLQFEALIREGERMLFSRYEQYE